MRYTLFALPLLLTLGTVGCSTESDSGEEFSEGLESSSEEIRESAGGPLVRASNAEVWAVENQWADKTTANAKKAGVAWEADSGLSWEQKFTKWIESMERVDGAVRSGGYQSSSKTLRFRTPQGRVIDGPVLECADVAIWLRVTFAAWYHLPFFMTGYASGQPIYFGHFGVIDKAGNPVSGYALFKTLYKDTEKTWKAGDAWPTDSVLAKKHVGTDDDASGILVDGKPLPAGAGAGAYFDQAFLNKRVGHLLVLLDANFGSAHLADGTVTYHAKAPSLHAGDVLVERWQKNGIGHVLPVMSVAHPTPETLRATLASGSMPRRQPNWDTASGSAYYFGTEATGGTGTAYDGNPYSKLGGGLKRWREPVVSGGRWFANVPVEDRGNWIPDDSYTAIAERPELFKKMMKEQDPEVAKQTALRLLNDARTTLKDKPASCSTRTKREDAFKELYDVMGSEFGKTKAQVDTEFRTLEDFVFAELSYSASKTCCWNTTTPAMAEIVIDYAKKEQDAAKAKSLCVQPTPFMSQKDGYARWKTHAATLGRAADWREWSEDEPCAQRAVAEDVPTAAGKLAYCPAPAAAP
jgi:hypothetical protein